jgi:hypothetical protein
VTAHLRHLMFAALRWVGVDEPVIGDMEETYQRGRSQWSLWREAVGALYAAMVGELRLHPVSVLACLAAGWLMIWEVAPAVIGVTIVAAVRSYDHSYFENGGMPPPHSGDFIWIVNFAILTFTNTAGGFAAVRWHTGQQRLLAIMFAATVMVQRMLLALLLSTAYDPSTARLYFVFRPVGATVVTLIALESMAALGGGMGAARSRKAPAQ